MLGVRAAKRCRIFQSQTYGLAGARAALRVPPLFSFSGASMIVGRLVRPPPVQSIASSNGGTDAGPAPSACVPTQAPTGEPARGPLTLGDRRCEIGRDGSCGCTTGKA